MNVRLATADDAPALAAVVAEVAAEGWILAEPPVDAGARAASMTELMRTGEARFWALGDADDAVAGVLGLHRTAAPGVLSIGMGVRAAARGRGGGRMLLEAALAHARADAAVHKVELDVFVWNAAAIALYARAGFAVEGLRRDHYRRRDGSLESVLVMATPA